MFIASTQDCVRLYPEYINMSVRFLVLVAVTTFLSDFQRVSPTTCDMPSWFKNSGKRVRSHIKPDHRDVVESTSACLNQCMNKQQCVAFDVIKARENRVYCLLYKYYTMTYHNRKSDNYEFKAKCWEKYDNPAFVFFYQGRYRLYTEPGGVITVKYEGVRACLKKCFANDKCRAVFFNKNECHLVTRKVIKRKVDMTLYAMTKGEPDRKPTYVSKTPRPPLPGNKNSTFDNETNPEPGQAGRLQAWFLRATLQPPTKECKYRYIGQYNITTSDQLTTVSATNIEACLEKCSQSESCHVASYHNGVCQLSTKEHQSSVNRSMKNGSSLFVKQHCSIRPPPQSWMLFPVLQVLFFAISFQFLF